MTIQFSVCSHFTALVAVKAATMAKLWSGHWVGEKFERVADDEFQPSNMMPFPTGERNNGPRWAEVENGSVHILKKSRFPMMSDDKFMHHSLQFMFL